MNPYISSFLLYFLFTAIPPSSQSFTQETETHLHLYLHENFTGPNPTSITAVTTSTPSSFGTIRVFENELREGADPISKLIGQSQGTGTTASRDEGSSLVEANFVFTIGEYKGSTLAIFGRPIRLLLSSWEVNVIGGTGKFRLARGYAIGRNIVVEPGRNIIVEFDLYFRHHGAGCSKPSSASYCLNLKEPSVCAT
ncbi:uncharacterized protein A4U43_C10F9500 [Asparagus officinalis]|uniref:Dirigent protein n=1 Tax=Asparagus officinalis TaxID=4686 RepID=A0A5P1E4Y2_ASPOF|nr:dirigent protein 1-like [Asparagus officinalis]ONK56505.1 uncharacterized protein A4U43_C10F9500 [Asparagus officinalis]